MSILNILQTTLFIVCKTVLCVSYMVFVITSGYKICNKVLKDHFTVVVVDFRGSKLKFMYLVMQWNSTKHKQTFLSYLWFQELNFITLCKPIFSLSTTTKCLSSSNGIGIAEQNKRFSGDTSFKRSWSCISEFQELYQLIELTKYFCTLRRNNRS